MNSGNEHPENAQQAPEYGPVLDELAKVEAAYEQSIQGTERGPEAARAWYLCTFTGEYHIKAYNKVFISCKLIFLGGHGEYCFSGTLEGIGLTVGGVLSGWGRFGRHPSEVPSQVWCSAGATIPAPFIPNFLATLYRGDEHLGELTGWALGLGAAFRASEFVDWRKC